MEISSEFIIYLWVFWTLTLFLHRSKDTSGPTLRVLVHLNMKVMTKVALMDTLRSKMSINTQEFESLFRAKQSRGKNLGEMSTYLSEELMLKILCRLPPKSLIPYNPLNYSILIAQETPNHPLLLVKGTEKFITKRAVLSFLSYKTLDSVCQIPLPLKLVASCKGLLCLHKFRTSDVYLWNPATPSVGLKALPPVTRLPYHVHDVFGSCLGFGFDSRSNDFKVVRIRIIEFQTNGIENFFHMNNYVEVYSLSGGSWRLLDLQVPMYFAILVFESVPGPWR